MNEKDKHKIQQTICRICKIWWMGV